jgi:hypothetical protein
LRLLFRACLVAVVLVVGAIAWDVWQLRSLRPPDDRSFEGFVRAGRQGVLVLDKEGERLYWVAPLVRTIVPRSQPPAYEFDRSGRLLNWAPGGVSNTGMLLETPVQPRGVPATTQEARAWLRRN